MTKTWLIAILTVVGGCTSAGDDGAPQLPPDAPPPAFTGVVQMTSFLPTINGGQPNEVEASRQFWRTPMPVAAGRCAASVPHGGCCVTETMPTYPTFLDAGELTLMNQTTGEVDTDVFDATQGFYAVWDGPLLWNAGHVLSLSAAGADYPAVPALTVTYPQPVEGVAVAEPASLAAGITVTWTPGTADAVHVIVKTANAASQIECDTDDADGSLAIPAELADVLSPGAATALVSRRNLGAAPTVPGFSFVLAWDALAKTTIVP